MAHEYTTWAYRLEIKGAGRKFVLVALADIANELGYAFPGQKRLMRMTGQSERSVREHLDWLEKGGYVLRKERRRDDGTRTSDGYYLPEKDTTGEISRWPTTGETCRLTENPNNPEQDSHNPEIATGSSRRLSTGRILHSHRQILPKSPAESAGHELPEELPEELQPPPTPKTPAAPEPEIEEAVEAELPQAETEKPEPTWRQLPVFVEKALSTFHGLHNNANPAMLDAWRTEIRKDVIEYGETAALEALNISITDFATLRNPFRFYRACVKAYKPITATPAPAERVVDDGMDELIRKAKEGTL